MHIRPMRGADVEEAERVTDEAFHRLAAHTRTAEDSAPTRRSAGLRSQWCTRTRHLLDHDPQGSWVAEEGDRMLGAVVSLRRETLWGLSALAVRDDARRRSVGRQLLEAALTYSQGCVRGLICASADPAALRLFHAAGFAVHPTMRAAGSVDRSTLPVVEGVRTGSTTDVDLLESVDRHTRGAGHGVDHALMTGSMALLVADNHLGSGYCYLSPGGGLYLLAATGERLAQRLAWEAMARGGAEFSVGAVTAEQDWLVEVMMRARLSIHHDGYLATRFMRPPWPYVPSPHLL